jgi:membrane associated rhomboid family serine protease
MNTTPVTGILLIIITIAFSYQGFRDSAFFDTYKFKVEPIIARKDYKRLITSGFLHSDWMHLAFNMFSLYAFCDSILLQLGTPAFLAIYFASMVGGDLLSLWIHRNHADYSAIGASGAVCGIIFASIALYPGIGISFFFLPTYIPSWLFGLGYVLLSIYGIRTAKDNVGHDAHLGGAVIGMLTALAFHPAAIKENYITILLILLPALFFIVLIITRPQLLYKRKMYIRRRKSNHYSIDHQYNAAQQEQLFALDDILDKIHRKGMKSLTKQEKDILQKHSDKV